MEEKRVYISQRIVVWSLLVVWLTLWLASVIHDIIMFSIGTETRIWRLDVDSEESFYTWLSTLILAIAGGILLVISSSKFSDNDKFRFHWLVLGLGFIFMSMDEALSFHEQLSGVLSGVIDTSGLFNFAWVIPISILVVILAGSYLSFLLHLDRKFAGLFLLSGCIFVFGALGMEFIAGHYVSGFEEQDNISNYLTPTYRIMTNIEEGLEGGGIVLFIYALLEYCRSYSIRVIQLKK